MEAAREGHEEMVALLLFHDSDINAITEETQETALTLACCGGCYEVAKFLLEAGADANLGSASTPLMEAAQEGHLELVQLLLKAGAEINKFTISTTNSISNTNNNQTSKVATNYAAATTCESALNLSCENGHTDVVDALIKAGAEFNRPDPEKGYTPLMKACRTGQFCTIQYLLTNYYLPSSTEINRTTPLNEHSALSLACQSGHLKVVELLLQYGSDPLQALKDNSNCLIEASKGGHTKIVELLIDWNYTFNINNSNNTKENIEDKILKAPNKENSVPQKEENRKKSEVPYDEQETDDEEDRREIVGECSRQSFENIIIPLNSASDNDEASLLKVHKKSSKRGIHASCKIGEEIIKAKNEPALIKQIKNSVSRLDTASGKL